jgi:uncharacterized protein (UPF0262 family)
VPEATLSELRIDEATWGSGSPQRKHEWRLAVSELVDEGLFELADGAPGPLRGLLLLSDGAAELTVSSPDGPVARETVPLQHVRPLADEYIQVCVEMGKLGEGKNSPKLEALDIAKRLVHDEAGELMRALLRTFRPDHATARRLFTLLVTLLHDTTRLATPAHPART